MAIDFPQSPATGDQFTAGATTYEYDGEKWISTGTSPNSRLTRGANSLEITAGNDLVWTGNHLQLVDTAETTASLFINGTKKSSWQAQDNFGSILYSYDGEPLIFSASSGSGFSERLRITSANNQFTGRIFINGTEGGFDYNNVANTLEFLTTDGSTHSELNSNAYVPAGTKNLGASNSRWDNVYCNTVNVATGINFSAAQPSAGNSATMQTEVLDSYEEGTWTPTINKSGVTGSVTSPTDSFGYYRKVGGLLFLSFYFYKSSGSFGNNTLRWYVGGLPFNVVSTTNSAYNFLNAGYMGLNGTNYNFDSNVPSNGGPAGARWQANSTNTDASLTLYGSLGTVNWTSGALEFSGCGVVMVN